MKIKFLYILFFAVALTSCGEYNKVLKSTDNDLKYNYAKKYYNEQKFGRSSTLFQDILPSLKGTAKEEEALYLLAQSFFNDKDYLTANQYYKVYCSEFPKGQYIETAYFNSAYGLYLDSPDARLDQSSTYKAIQGFQDFLEYYPESDKVKLAQKYMFELQEKLAYKEFLAARLYFNLGNYMGNNYESCVVTAREALKSYPFSKYAEEYQILIVRSRYEIALQSVESKKPTRFRDVKDEYFNYKNSYPEGKYTKEVEKYYRRALKELNETPEDDLPTSTDDTSNKKLSKKEKKEIKKEQEEVRKTNNDIK